MNAATPRHLPMFRAECERGPRPCPHVTCRHHLDGTESCSLDVASNGDHTIQEVAALMGITVNAVVILERRAMRNVRNGTVVVLVDRAPRPDVSCVQCGKPVKRTGEAGRPAMVCGSECRHVRRLETLRVAAKTGVR